MENKHDIIIFFNFVILVTENTTMVSKNILQYKYMTKCIGFLFLPIKIIPLASHCPSIVINGYIYIYVITFIYLYCRHKFIPFFPKNPVTTIEWTYFLRFLYASKLYIFIMYILHSGKTRWICNVGLYEYV